MWDVFRLLICQLVYPFVLFNYVGQFVYLIVRLLSGLRVCLFVELCIV